MSARDLRLARVAAHVPLTVGAALTLLGLVSWLEGRSRQAGLAAAGAFCALVLGVVLRFIATGEDVSGGG